MPQLIDIFVIQRDPMEAGPEHAPGILPGRRSYQLVRSLKRGEAKVYELSAGPE